MAINPTDEAGYRDYLPNDPAVWGDKTSLGINHTDPNEIVLSLELNPDIGDGVQAMIRSRDVARRMGTDLLMWIGSGMTHTNEDVKYETVSGLLKLRVTDSVPMVLIGDIDAENFDPPQYGAIEIGYEDAQDLGQRLIIWAGVLERT